LLVTVFNKDSGLYEVMDQVAAIPHLRQPKSTADALYKQAPLFRSSLQLTGDELALDIGASFELARNKTMKRVRQKSAENGSSGDDITDYARGSIMIGHWKQVEALRQRTSPVQNDGVIKIAGNRLVYYMDNFAEPLGNGMRRLMQKYDVTNDNEQHQICEIQARVEAMRAAEKLTHRIYEMKRDFTQLAVQLTDSDPKLAAHLKTMAGHCADLIKPIHDLEAMRNGYDVLITVPYDPATAPSPNNPILQMLMNERRAAAQLKPILEMTSPPRRNATTFTPGLN
jgi:hypothetical protein